MTFLSWFFIYYVFGYTLFVCLCAVLDKKVTVGDLLVGIPLALLWPIVVVFSAAEIIDEFNDVVVWKKNK